MTPCPRDEDLVRFIDRSLPVEEAERLQVHLARCPACRAKEGDLQMLVSDLKGSPVDIDVRLHTQAVMARLDAVTESATPRNAWLFAGAGSAAACALVASVYLGWRTPAAKDTWQSRGGPTGDSIGRDVGVETYAVEGGLRPLASGSVIDETTPLTAGFRNLGHAPAFLLLFAVDTRREVHWISPPYARIEDDPVATELPTAEGERMLGTTVVLENVAQGPLRIFAVVMSKPAHVSDVEAIGGAALDATRLLRRLPGADIRETLVQEETQAPPRPRSRSVQGATP
jgi:hypothetical protein